MPAPAKTDPIRHCPICGSLMERKRFNGRLEDRTRFLKRKTCSQTCGNSRDMVQANTHRWRARQIHKRIQCERCSATSGLHVHHKDRDVSNNAPTNLVTLCATCHLQLHWQEDRAERMESILANTSQPSSDGKRHLAGKLPHQLTPRGAIAPTD